MEHQPSPQALALLAEIRKVFADVRRGKGTTLHETEVIDRYGTTEERKTARTRDTDHRWWEVKEAWIEEITGVGGLNFLDHEGYHYYLPAYLSYWLRRGEEPDCLAFTLDPTYFADRESVFTPAELRLLARVLLHLALLTERSAESRRRSAYWKKYLEG